MSGSPVAGMAGGALAEKVLDGAWGEATGRVLGEARCRTMYEAADELARHLICTRRHIDRDRLTWRLLGGTRAPQGITTNLAAELTNDAVTSRLHAMGGFTEQEAQELGEYYCRKVHELSFKHLPATLALLYGLLSSSVSQVARQLSDLAESQISNLGQAAEFRMKYFGPGNQFPTRLVYRGDYMTPYRVSSGAPYSSSTEVFNQWMGMTFAIMNLQLGCEALSPERVTPANLDAVMSQIVQRQSNVISYASSKINPVTAHIMNELETT